MDLSVGLKNALTDGNCVLFVGAGIAHNTCDIEGNRLPLAAELAQDIDAAFNLDVSDAHNLPKVAEILQLRRGRRELVTDLKTRLSGFTPDTDLAWIITRKWRAIFTTNYDDIIEQCFNLVSTPSQAPVSIGDHQSFKLPNPLEVPIYHLHGTIFGENPNPLVSQTDYTSFRHQREWLFEVLKHHFATYPILYLGYSNSDPNWGMVLDELQREFHPASPPESYRVAPATPPEDREILESRGVHSIDGTVADFATAVRASLGGVAPTTSWQPPDDWIPQDLKGNYETSPVATLRLLESWVYVNQADFNQSANVAEFLNGEPPSWSLIDQGRYFERDLQEPLTDELLDFATEQDPGVRSLLVSGSAGYGLTTLLRALAVQLVSERAGTVLWLKPGHSVQEGDVRFALSDLPAPVFLFVDNAAEQAAAIASIVRRLREGGQTTCFVLAERLNEWRQAAPRLSPREYEIESLSDPEIERLLTFLASEHALGALADLDARLQRAAIQNRHAKQLLVVMQEATQGRAFEAIIEDEYRGIDSDDGRHVYAVVSGAYRHRALIRDLLLSKVAALPVTSMFAMADRELKGVVKWEEGSGYAGVNAARARHHLIADIIWHRLLAPGERSSVLLSTVAALNLNYGLDAKLFEALIRSDESIDSLESFDDRVRFFEASLRKEPRSPYVRQHYARMLLREDREELALSQINEAINYDGGVRVLYHTKGLILTNMAVATADTDMGRRRLVQAEGAFSQAISMSPKDSYGYHGLARLYLSWAQEVPSEEEATRYLEKCEETVSTGLNRSTDHEHLYVISSELSDYVGDNPGAIESLKRAVGSSEVARYSRYLLGRAYYRQRQFDDARDVLKPLVESSPEEWRALVEYVRCVYELGASFEECLAVLSLAPPAAYRDPRYVSYLGGMYFLSGQFSKAQDVFDEARGRSLSAAQRHRVEFEPRAREGSSLRLEGEVARVSGGYSMIEVSDYPRVLLPGSKYGGLIMERGMRIRFQLVFTAGGAVAADPEAL